MHQTILQKSAAYQQVYAAAHFLAPEWSLALSYSRGVDRGYCAPPKHYAYFIVLQGLNFRKKIMLTRKNLGYSVFTSRLLLFQLIGFSNKLSVSITEITRNLS